MRAQPAWSEIEIEWDGISAQLGHLLGRLTELAGILDASQWWQSEHNASASPSGASPSATAGPGHALQALHYAQTDLAEILQVADDIILRPLNHQEESVAWLELSGNGRSAAGPSRSRRSADAVTLRSAPIHVSEKLASDLFGKKRSVLLTGATLQAGESLRIPARTARVLGGQRVRHRQPL